MRDDYPDHVSRDEQPSKTVENIPDDIVEGALSIGVGYGACPECGEEQFYNRAPGRNAYHDCVECGFGMTIVG